MTLLAILLALHASTAGPAVSASGFGIQIAGTLAAPAAQDGAAPTKQDPRDEELQALEERVTELEGELGARGDAGGPLSLGQRLKLQGFGHVEGRALDVDSDAPGADSTTDAFALGGLDLFLTSQLSERISFLNETVFKQLQHGESELGVERLIVKYAWSDALNLHAGRFHTTLGFWNETYHHGEWLQTSVGRPKIVDFEGNGGVLPIHLVGLVLKGRAEYEACAVDYTMELGNGRGPVPDQVETVSDANDGKAVNLSVAVHPAAVEGLDLGGGAYLDSIPANTVLTMGPLHGELDERIGNLFAVYRAGGWEILSEYFDIEHEGSPKASSDGWYLQVGRRYGDWTPYARFDVLEVDDLDPFYKKLDDLTTVTLGVRWDLSFWNAIKVQVSETDVDAAAGGPDEKRRAFVVQTAFSF